MKLESMYIAPGLTMADVAAAAGKAGAEAYADAQAKGEQERRRQRETAKREFEDRIKGNTKLLLRNYRAFRSYIENATYEAKLVEDPLDIIKELMMPGRDNTVVIESIKRSVARTATIVDHIEKMIKLYRADCYLAATPEAERRWRVIDGLYVSDVRRTVRELAKEEQVTERTIYKDVDIAAERISVFIFGVDGIKR